MAVLPSAPPNVEGCSSLWATMDAVHNIAPRPSPVSRVVSGIVCLATMAAAACCQRRSDQWAGPSVPSACAHATAFISRFPTQPRPIVSATTNRRASACVRQLRFRSTPIIIRRGNGAGSLAQWPAIHRVAQRVPVPEIHEFLNVAVAGRAKAGHKRSRPLVLTIRSRLVTSSSRSRIPGKCRNRVSAPMASQSGPTNVHRQQQRFQRRQRLHRQLRSRPVRPILQNVACARSAPHSCPLDSNG